MSFKHMEVAISGNPAAGVFDCYCGMLHIGDIFSNAVTFPVTVHSVE